MGNLDSDWLAEAFADNAQNIAAWPDNLKESFNTILRQLGFDEIPLTE